MSTLGPTPKTLLRVLKMPWLATIRTSLSWSLLFVVFVLAVDVSKIIIVRDEARQFGVALLAFAVACVWKMVANTLWLARDARELRLPGVERDADRVLPLFALASVLLPALVLGAVFGHPLTWFISLALVAMGTLAFCILPTVLVLPLSIVAIALLFLAHAVPPLPGNPHFFAWAVPASIVLTLASLQRWIAIRRTATLDCNPWLRPIAAGGRRVQLRKLRGEIYRVMLPDRKNPPRKPATGQLHRIGPAHPVRSIQVALGWTLKPLNLRADARRRWRMQLLLATLIAAPAVVALLARRYYGTDAVTRFALQWPMFLAIVIVTPVNRLLTAFWRGQRSNLALLALLPRLGDPARIHRDALAASLSRVLSRKLGLIVAIALASYVLRPPPMFFAYLALIFACGTLLEIALATHVLGGKPLSQSAEWALIATIIFVPMMATAIAVQHPTRDWLAVLAVALWLAWCAGLTLFGWFGWRALRRRPHPFLANAP